MDSRTAAHALTQIAAYLELRGEARFRSRAYEQAAGALVALDADDLAPLDHDGTLAQTRGIGPATLAVVRDLIASGESRYLEQLRASMPPGLLELLRIPSLGAAKIAQIHAALEIDSLDQLEQAARDGRLATVKGFGPRTVERLLKGIELARRSGSQRLLPRARAESIAMLAAVRTHRDVVHAEVAGSLRRHNETIADVDIVAACSGDPRAVAVSFANAPGVLSVARAGTTSPSITYVDGTCLDLYCVSVANFATALWRATGSASHVHAVTARLADTGYALVDDTIHDASGARVPLATERELYALAGLTEMPPELREGGDESLPRNGDAPPRLLELGDLRGVLHCHSTYSDGKATIAEMAAAARERGWSYLGITDHSQAAFYAGGLKRDQVLAQHDEIDALNAVAGDFRLLKGIEADILADGALDYDDELLDRFDFVVGSIHSRFTMDQPTMTARVLRALDDPRLTILGHPTGRLLLAREAYAIDMEPVLEKAGANGVAVEINADPHRLDLDWRLSRRARALGVTMEIGPDAHSTAGLDNVSYGVGIARKGGLSAREVLNARSVDDVLAFARARRSGGR